MGSASGFKKTKKKKKNWSRLRNDDMQSSRMDRDKEECLSNAYEAIFVKNAAPGLIASNSRCDPPLTGEREGGGGFRNAAVD